MRISATTRIVLGLSLLTLSVLLVARSLGLGPNDRARLMQGRSRLCESLAISSSLFIKNGDTKDVRTCLQTAVKHNPDLISAAVRRQDGTLLAEAGDHQSHWATETERQVSDQHVFVPLVSRGRDWGKLEITFHGAEDAGLLGFWNNSMTRFIAFVAAACCLPFFVFLRRLVFLPTSV